MQKIVDALTTFVGYFIGWAWIAAIIAVPLALTVACINWVIKIIGG